MAALTDVFTLYLLVFILNAAVSFSSGRTIPGLDFIPRPDPSYHRDAFIRMTYGDTRTFDGYLATLNATEEAMSATPDNAHDCQQGGYTPPPGAFCRFDFESLGPCTKGNAFGYPQEQPCILLQLNTVTGWKPIVNRTRPDIMVECHGKNPPDKDNIGKLEYYPSGRNIKPYFFPFNNQPGYMAPLVAVRFTRPRAGTIVFVECTASDAQGLVGRTNFELLVN